MTIATQIQMSIRTELRSGDPIALLCHRLLVIAYLEIFSNFIVATWKFVPQPEFLSESISVDESLLISL